MRAVFFLLVYLLLLSSVWALTSEVVKSLSSQVQGLGPLLYNYRIIDKTIHAGGHPLNPVNNFKNSDQQVLTILKHLKDQSVEVIIDLENTQRIQARYAQLLKQAGIRRIHLPMTESKVPTEKEWLIIKTAMQKPVYIHCKWGADRTGAIIGRYLVEEKGYTPQKALKAVQSSGSHAGRLGGLKNYKKLIGFFWPDYQP
ncbi:hypothetical protein A2548_05165 [candidate division WOR-1 bacterium RIFOXYD2_FULL_41_8]|nr:MAG: hypothetical protein A2548_05165 [candidate division WOR-1 bacterium RIFOXYD2_FULL_41_8]